MNEQIHLTIQTLSGKFEGDFDKGQKLQDVIDKALLTLDIKPAPGEDYVLTYDESELSPQETIDHYKIPSGAILYLATKEGGGGHRVSPHSYDGYSSK